MLTTSTYPVLNEDCKQHQPKLRRQDFVWPWDVYLELHAIARDVGLSMTQTVIAIIRQEFRNPRLVPPSASKDESREMRIKLKARG
jgi:hypothetical protein